MTCSNAAKTRNQLKFAGMPQTGQPISAVSLPYCEDMWRRYCCLTSFFPIVDMCLSCEDIARHQMAIFWRLFCCILYFQRATCSTFQTCILNSHYGHTMCGSMADIQSVTAEIRRGKKTKEETTGQKYNGLPYSIGRPQKLRA